MNDDETGNDYVDLEGVAVASQHHTLKYHLLGPSLTKSGQDGVDQKKVSEIIYNASKGSKYFNNEEVKDKGLTVKIDRILVKRRQLEKLDLSHDLRKADDYIAGLELGRDLSQVVVHIDCDAFYAAVEELDRPELRDVPMAVGKGVLTTCNYHARKFGCRSGMASFVALKLCPQLVCIPVNFEKYTAKARDVREILALYDPRFESASIDEAYLNITKYCTENDVDPEEAVAQMRQEVHQHCKITISAGIAANAKLAKICSNKNKPNGQYRLAPDRATILAFMHDLPTRKVNGIGRVFERELDAIGVKTCGDIYEHRAYLSRLFGEKAFQFLMGVYLGLGRTNVQPAEEYERKSVGTESTFKDMGDGNELREKLRWIAEELEKDMERTQFKGRTLVLKAKLHTYEVLTRQTAPPKAVHTADDLYRYSLPMLAKLEREIPGMKLRLMGLRCTHLVRTKKADVDFFGRSKGLHSGSGEKMTPANDPEWEIWPDAEFEDAARQEREEDIEELERLSQQDPAVSIDDLETAKEREAFELRKHNNGFAWRALLEKERKEQEEEKEAARQADDEKKRWDCPICGLSQVAEDRAFNEHIDSCLSKQTIKEIVKTNPPERVPASPTASGTKGKRGRPRNDKLPTHETKRPKKAFFT
ncbi:hypothetical protein LTR66_001435 [Elasticomyces elasticus]|nr:hypothetical protein LTR50_005764 [Elasticomyces elasticus]KAK4999555.1 hypothetical protein LTR66_001435 [Elasticomyces elasticus]